MMRKMIAIARSCTIWLFEKESSRADIVPNLEKEDEGDHRPDDGEHDGEEREHAVEAPEKTG